MIQSIALWNDHLAFYITGVKRIRDVVVQCNKSNSETIKWYLNGCFPLILYIWLSANISTKSTKRTKLTVEISTSISCHLNCSSSHQDSRLSNPATLPLSAGHLLSGAVEPTFPIPSASTRQIVEDDRPLPRRAADRRLVGVGWLRVSDDVCYFFCFLRQIAT